ncbi:acetolactate synthase large subunit [Ramlibacter sp. AN1015]|uniref:acetolactate synthase large subunit n=1 Tax=Ramlibacter sp. AN1015 TaxID=3133428 RepID=UPI0030BC9A56
MNGADSLCETLLANGVEVCFANPGTSEMHFVAALDRQPRMRCILGTSEGVVTGAADGWGRMSGRPAATLLHLGPGLANGLANLHNARRARTPLVNIVGDHASDHLQYDAPLTSDIESLARPMSHHVRRIASVGDVAAATAQAVGIARQPPGNVATLILPADTAWTALPATQSPGRTPPVAALRGPTAPAADAVRAAADALRRHGAATTLLMGGAALQGRALVQAGRIARATGARLLAETANARMARGRSRTPIARLPYGVDLARATLAPVRALVRVGAREPVAFFRYPDKPSVLVPDGCEGVELADVGVDLALALDWLADELGLGPAAPGLPSAAPVAAFDPTAPLSGRQICAVVAALLPDNAIVCDESISQGRDFCPFSEGASPHDYLQLTGGAIGIGMPLATGAALACPDRKVVTLQADGSGLYTLQALWTQARESLDCLTIIFANRSYATLHGEMRGVGASGAGRNARRMLDLVEPAHDWVALARGMGVPGIRVADTAAFARAFAAACSERGPFLIEAHI